MQGHQQASAEGSGNRPGEAVKRGSGSQLRGLLLFVGASALVAALASLVTLNNVNGWYASADKAPWTPPNRVFGPVWTVLYLAMAVAAWLVWRREAVRSRQALTAYEVQLLLNLLWTPVFFGLYPVMGTAALWIAFGIIVALAVAVSVTVLLFGPISRAAGLLMLPYLTWVVFAASLNLWAALNN